MSTADRAAPGPRRARAQRGFTVLEMMVVVGIVAATTLIVERTVSAVHDTERTMRAIRNTTERGHQAAYRLRDMVNTSRKLFQNDAVGNAYLGALALGSRPLAPGSRLPTFDETRPLGPDEAGDPRVGNVLLFIREADPVPCVADPTTKKIRLIDCYRFVCVYLSPSARTLVTGGPVANDLVEWRSWAYPNYGQVMAITNSTERTRVARDLYQTYNFDELWDPNKPYATAFYDMNGSGTIAGTGAVPKTGRIDEDTLVSKGGQFVYANVGVARTDTSSRPRTPAFSVEDPGTWAPNGFEVKICGTSGARKVWMRLTIEQQAFRGRVPAQETVVVANTRDL
jgi:prepilin-type N-terminal cleavage/methylation domain-containing protein